LELTSRGFIKVDDSMRSVTDPHVWAVGDVIEVRNSALGGDATWAVALGGPANRQGRICADHIAGKANAGTYRGTIGASVVKVFSLTAASVGVNEKFLRSSHLNYKAIYLHPNHHAGYYPDAHPVHLKLLFDPSNGKIFGAQAVGLDGIEKRIDVISTAMQGGLSASDLAYIELCYAPPYNSARDPVNFAGMIAENIMDGLDDTITPLELVDMVSSGKLMDNGTTVIDVREAGELAGNKFLDIVPSDCRLHIALNELRAKIGSLRGSLRKADGPIIVSCHTGQRAHVASRMLRQNGFTHCKVLTGSYQTYSIVQLSQALKKARQ
jgi:rhodanese-related sulfurtransferase